MESDVTQMLNAIESGDANAADQLMPLVYEELRRLAAQKMANERAGQTLQATALVHEAWIKLAGSTGQQWRGRKHFFSAAAEAMRRILIDRARKRNRTRHGKGMERLDLHAIEIAETATDAQLLAVDEALQRLAEESPERAELVKLRYYVGMSIPDAAEALGISESTAKRQWNYVRLWLFREIKSMGEGGMGAVYMAEQTEPVTRKVALKIIKLGMDTKQVVARFEAERQALAMMDHHHIAKVLDAGATDAGRPFFVMKP